jgi:hypothetical protein
MSFVHFLERLANNPHALYYPVPFGQKKKQQKKRAFRYDEIRVCGVSVRGVSGISFTNYEISANVNCISFFANCNIHYYSINANS